MWVCEEEYSSCCCGLILNVRRDAVVLESSVKLDLYLVVLPTGGMRISLTVPSRERYRSAFGSHKWRPIRNLISFSSPSILHKAPSRLTIHLEIAGFLALNRQSAICRGGQGVQFSFCAFSVFAFYLDFKVMAGLVDGGLIYRAVGFFSLSLTCFPVSSFYLDSRLGAVVILVHPVHLF